MAEESNAWVFDSLICFLHGPIWNAPLQTFIEERCIIFDPHDEGDGRKLEYKKAHDDYKHLVDYMLSTFMEEMHITPEQFEVACLAGRKAAGGVNAVAFTQSLFQQIWAANDIKIFSRMMSQRNVELQLQAIDIIERKHRGAKRDSLPDESSASGENEAVALTPVNDVTAEELEQIAAAEAEAEQEIIKAIEKEFAAMEISVVQATTSIAMEPPPPPQPDTTTDDIVEDPSDKLDRLNLMFDNENAVDSAEMKARQKYLREQRDKILAIKKKARTQQLNDSVKMKGRPTSARAAQKLIQGHVTFADNLVVEEDSLRLRKTLAKRLREEVVDVPK